jgi:hypothetical protein
LIAIGFVARDQGIPAAWMVSAMLFLASAPAYLLLERFAAAANRVPTDEAPAAIPAKASPPALT